MASVSEIRKSLENLEQSFIRSTEILTSGQWCDRQIREAEELEAAFGYYEKPASIRLISGERMIC